MTEGSQKARASPFNIKGQTNRSEVSNFIYLWCNRPEQDQFCETACPDHKLIKI